ncbi:hypothetical protein [Fluviispira multicolorata]|uniref:Uncharacterized protein n=1 Tax=Fluviispira multicolorata TaxID=2654512 RepID=A0A833JGF1_9BACT|nr:hypothetical protein [Fluviispira multicolorata]KAB8032111.1 hypothetical protein GCL57_05545 [Fluviispira multicolorata]
MSKKFLDKEHYLISMWFYLERVKRKDRIFNHNLANKFGYSLRQFERITKDINGNYIKSLQLLHDFACLEGMTLSEFILFLENRSNVFKNTEEASFQIKTLFFILNKRRLSLFSNLIKEKINLKKREKYFDHLFLVFCTILYGGNSLLQEVSEFILERSATDGSKSFYKENL